MWGFLTSGVINHIRKCSFSFRIQKPNIHICSLYLYSVLSEKSAEWRGGYLVACLSRAFKLHVKESVKMFLIEQNDMHLQTAIEMQI